MDGHLNFEKKNKTMAAIEFLPFFLNFHFKGV